MSDINEINYITPIELYKVFFIIGIKSNFDYDYKCSLSSKEGMINFKRVYINNEEENKMISVYSFEIIPKELKDKNIHSKKYQAKINLNYNNNKYNGLILFKESRNNFIYDFKFEEKNEKNIHSEIFLSLGKLEQLKIFISVLKILKIKLSDPISLDLLIDSQILLTVKNKTYNFDFYLEILKLCYSKKEVKVLLMMFNLNRVNLPQNLNIKNYSLFLNLIEKKPNVLTKFCSQNDNKEKYLKIFYNLLLYFRVNYEEDKVQNLLNKKELWKYYIEILPINHKYYFNIEIPDELINEILKQKVLSYSIIKGTLSYITSNKNILISINNNCNSIFEFCSKTETILNMNDLIHPNEIDDLKEIIIEIVKIINFELSKNKQFVSFNEEFWKKYLEFDINKNYEKKKLIRNAIFVCQNIDKELDINNFELNIDDDDYQKDVNIKKEKDNSEKKIIEKRLLMATIGNVSVGKSYFLNSLFGIDFCQVKSDITTKFILFIRHINNLKSPQLYNLQPIKNGDSYDFIKDDEIITGENSIKNKINDINRNFENDGKPMFYMLEIEIKSIKNKTFLNQVDFLDVPGLNESGINYIDIYFPYIKDMIKYCLIIFSTENYNSKDSLDVISKVKENIYIPMKNFLLILNKIDKVDGKIEETIHDFKKIIFDYEGINYFDNTIVPVNSHKLKSEIQIEIDFNHFINYYFIEYYNTNKENEMFSFLEYIKRKIRNIEPEKKLILKTEIKTLKNELVKDIKSSLESFIKEMQSKGYALMIDLEDKNELNTLKMFYLCFRNRLLVPKNSNTLKEINNYFNAINDYSLPKKNEINNSEEEIFIYDNSEEHKFLKNLDNFFNNVFNSSKLRKFGNIVPLLNNDFKVLKNYILNSELIYIPILGISNSGKSSFLNCLIQKDILSCNSSECTRRGMIIRYIQDKNSISLYSIKFKHSDNLNNTYYYYIKKGLLSKKIEEIKEIINITNESYPKNEEDSFFLLEINIPFLDDIKIKSEIKNNICFIDFPGHNTNNNLFFDREVYQKVLKMSSFFIYLNSGKAFKEESNKILLSRLFKEVINIREGDISPEEYIDLCLFIFNKVDTLEKSEKNLDGIQEEIKEILNIPKNVSSNISCSFFSSLLYKKLIEKKLDYKTEKIVNSLYLKFQSQNEEIDDDDLFDNEEETTFLEYMKVNLSKKIKFDYYEKPYFELSTNDSFIYSDIYKELKTNLENILEKKNILKDDNYEKNILYICKLLAYCQENFSKLNYYKESYAYESFEKMRIKINKSYELKEREYINHLERFFYFMNIFFRIKNKFQKKNAKEDFEKISKKVINNMENIFNEFKGEKIIIEYKKQILEFINIKQKDFKILMQENGNNIEQVIFLINEKINKKIEEFRKSIQEELTGLETKIAKEMTNIGISETSLIDREIKYEETLGVKILMGFHYCTFGLTTIAFGIGYGLLYALPNFLINKAFDDRKYKQFIDEEKEYLNKLMKSYSNSIKKNLEKFKKLSFENANRLLGLLESNSIETDEFWKEAKEQYIKIYNDYKSLKHLD